MKTLPSIALLALCLSPELPGAGELDTSFNPNANGEIKAVAVASDGKIMIGGAFTNVGGKQQAQVTRLLSSGQPDLTWTSPTAGATVQTLAVLGDGNVAVAAPYFQRPSVCRLKSNGSLDPEFEVRLTDGEVRAMNVDIDGNLLVAGNFNMPSGHESRGFVIVEPNGVVKGKNYAYPDTGRSVNTLSARSDRSIVLGGDFPRLRGDAKYVHLAKMTSGATLDSTYLSPLTFAEGKSVDCLALQNYEIVRTIVGGNFSTRLIEGVPENRCLARISSSGTLDASFNPVFTRLNGVPRVTSVVVQCDGKIIAAGDFTAVNGVSRLGLVRLNPSGSVDTSFVATASGATGATGLALQADGKVLVTGTFQQLNGAVRNRIARLNNDPNRETLSIRQNEITWSRVGSMPESDLVSFEVSSDAGKTWQILKAPTRTSTTWRVSDINLPASGMIRARARVSSGMMNGSSGIAEKVTSYSLVPEISVSSWTGTEWIILTDGQTNPLDYGEIKQGSPETRTLGIYNGGWYELKVTGVQLPAGFSLVDPPVFPLTIGGNKSLSFALRADASALGAVGGMAIITSDDANESSFEFSLTAKVVGPEIAMHLGEVDVPNDRTEPISFAQGYQGTQQLRETVVISNQGTSDLNVSAISAGAGFTVDKPQPFMLQPGESREVQVGPDQSVAGSLTGKLEVYSDDFDEPVFRVPLAATVVNPLVTQVLNTRTTLNRKTGLREQKLRITNTTKTAMVGGFRVIVRGLPEGVVVRNASEILPDGSVVIEVHQTLGPAGKFVLVLEYEVPKGAPTVIYPQLTTEVILNAPKGVAAAALAVEKCERDCEGHFALIFRSVPGRLYQVEYSADGKEWKASTPTRAAGSLVRWLDCGCPHTECAPKDAPKRLYRVRELE